jgi:signal transduction histidine kinase/ActR/RegA family two-component response regulator
MLIDEFNIMLEQIHCRDVELKKVNDELEQRVECRTAELNHQVDVRRKAEDSFHNIIDRNVNGILVYDGESIVRFVNPTICIFLDQSQDALIGNPCPEELLDPDGAELPIKGPEGSTRFGEIRAAQTEWEGEAATMVSVHDITNRRNLQEQLMQSQKMEAVGRLAGGIAHDFNNLLTAILGYSDLLLDTMARDSQQREDVKIIKKAAERAKGLTRQLLAFSRRQVLQPTSLELCAVTDNMLQMLVRMIPEDIELKVEACNDPCRVFADAGQLEQIVMNLVVNARDAMEGAGHITISVNSTEITEAAAEEQVGAEAGMYAVLAVADTGSGMPDDVKEKIFEPFFTTKDVGQGTGLGLSTVYGIVHDSGGFVTVESEIGVGTTFRIYLPLAKGDAVMYEDTSSTKLPMASKTGGTILLVEDEMVVRELVKKVLTRFEYDVLVTESPDEALSVAAEYDGKIDLMLTDVVMPGLSGRQLADQISESRPHMKVLFMSGYTDDTVLKHGVRHEGMAFLHKPFPPEVLIEKIEQILIHGDASGMSPEV